MAGSIVAQPTLMQQITERLLLGYAQERHVPVSTSRAHRYPPGAAPTYSGLTVATEIALSAWRVVARRRLGKLHILDEKGFKLQLDFDWLQDFKVWLLYACGESFEPGTASLLRSILREGDTFVDVGASIGFHSMLAGSIVGPRGSVYAFEPDPATFARLTRNAVLNGFQVLSLFKAALSDRQGSARLSQTWADSGRNRVVKRRSRSVPVETVLADVVLAGTHPSIIKIDVEGEESRVLQGLRRTIQNNPDVRMIVEWNSSYARRDLYDALVEQFDLYLVSESGRDGFDLLQISDYRTLPPFGNLWCTP